MINSCFGFLNESSIDDVYLLAKNSSALSRNTSSSGDKSYSSSIASTGHTALHAPQSMQTSGSIYNWSGPSSMQSTGQTLTHSPDCSFLHGSNITKAISIYLLL